MSIEAIGLAAGFLTTSAFVPQVWKIWRTRSVHDISYGMFGLFSADVALWLVYGLLIGSLPVILANGITLGAINPAGTASAMCAAVRSC